MIKIYRKDNFSFSHERADLRKICSLLSKNLKADEDIYIFANVELPEVTYRWGFGDNITERTYSNVSPDLIIMKKDSIAVIEMKSYPGLIKFPLSISEVFKGEWSSKFEDNAEQLINEGRGNPYSQVDNNRKAVVAYLIEKEKEFSTEECQGSNWEKAVSFILFSNNTVDFEHSKEAIHDPGNWYRTFHLGSLNENTNGEYFPDFLRDMTTSPRKYRTDERSEILFSETCIKTLSELLECNDVTDEYIRDDKELSEIYSLDELQIENPEVTSGVGYAPTLIHSIADAEDEDLKESFKPPKEELELSRELRLLAYYRRCLIEESKHEMKIFLETRTADEKRFILKNIRESIFYKNEPMKIPGSEIHNLHTSLQREDPSISYGFSLLIDKVFFNGREFWTAAPLFNTRVKFNQGAYEIAHDYDIMINQSVLKKISPFNDYDEENELQERIDEIVNEDARPSGIIKNIFNEIGVQGTLEELMVLKGLSPSLERGFIPSAGLIYKSESGIYNSLLSELRIIGNNWKEKIEKNEPIDDLAYNLLNGLSFESDESWDIPLYNVGHSNFEQSESIGKAMKSNTPITVVSGPPGTGKSQLATNLLAETNRKKERVIFSSYNNKAVDVLASRYNSLFTEEAIKRYSRRIQPSGIVLGTSGGQATNTGNNSGTPKNTLSNQQKQILDSSVMANNKELFRIKNKIEKYIEAQSNIETISNELENILHQNPHLQLINWYIDDAEKLNLEYWQKLLGVHKAKIKRGKSFINRVIDTLTEDHLSWNDLFDKESFQKKNKLIIINGLKHSLPEEVVSEIGENELLEFGEKYLGLLVQINKQSKLYKEYNSILEEIDDSIYDEWNEQTSKNTKDSITLLEEHIGTANQNTAVTTLSVGKAQTKLEPGIYDIAVLDESSQTDIISALPVLYRSKRAIIIGDEKQLFPIVKLDEENDLNTFLAYNLDKEEYHHYSYLHSSLLSVADKEIKKNNRRRTMLKEHFRCHPNIIGFSDRVFYDNALRIKTTDEGNAGIKWINHTNDCKPKWKNPNEVNIALECITQYIDGGKYEPHQIGLVTPFREQANLLTNQIARRFGQQVGNSILADTAHKFQGDERELMIFSLVVGPSMRSGTYAWIQEGKSKNLINVSVTRARKELIIIGNEEHILKKGGLLAELNLWSKQFSI